MIALGYTDAEKHKTIDEYRIKHGIKHIVVISADEFPLLVDDADCQPYTQIIEYHIFYRLLREITADSLIVINECLRNQNRYNLHYNCIRLFLNQTAHVLVFQQLPQIDTCEDFMILFDFATQSRWKRYRFDVSLIRENTTIDIRELPIAFRRIDIPTSAHTQAQYRRERIRRFETLGAADPHTLPRNLYLIGGKDKAAYIAGQSSLSLFDDAMVDSTLYVARNKRIAMQNIITYDDVQTSHRYTIVELPHAFADYADFMRKTWQAQADVLCCDLKVDHWYFNRYEEWSKRIHETYASLRS